MAGTWYSSISTLDPPITGIFASLCSGSQMVDYSGVSYTGQLSWVILEMPNRQIYTYQSHPYLPAPTAKELEDWSQPVIHRTPADYTTQPMTNVVISHPPTFNILGRQYDGWDSLFSKCGV
ncbi:uncharacterized protein BO96DRAFT_439450 [Aspergillus niger CBS 101883]|uniref:Contig An04c0240, genomic contig n=2 Tax=Aspergillus niger TaxID=5061 RepID=A2QJN9_ASPNC|nr:uncharacterized protein BO96DRAFT_439450 [Aspergillus niger CBS 101883]XP_059603663.1 uncharacterized protein An04g07730 [Aspergillus niger]PYH50930.1 hypothetical protein BO96DRAFT_439450 [Aspergillus niger CBS 101883]CAK44754.1 unnamed protein product [Aspergillus niger]